MDKLIINQLPVENLRGKRVFVRIDIDTTLAPPGVLFDEGKLCLALATLEHLSSVGARTIIGTHLGDPGGKVVDSLRLDPVAKRLSEMMGRSVFKLDEAIGRDVLRAVTDLSGGEALMLENLRFYGGEYTNDGEFAEKLAELCDVYCNDAFALAHHATASTVGITRYVRPAAAGLDLARELMMFESVIYKPDPPFLAIVAGARIEEKLPVLENLLPRLNRLFIGGALAHTFLKAKWLDVGGAPVDEEFVPLAEDLLNKAEKSAEVILPEDFIVVRAEEFKSFQECGGQLPYPSSWVVSCDGIISTEMPVDIGPLTLNRIRSLIAGAHTIFWNGPLGVWEIEPFAAGTREVARALVEQVSERFRRTIICGDSLSRALRTFDLPFERVRHLTTGGESALQLLAGNPLPAVAALDYEVDLVAPIERHPRKILLAVDGSEHSLEVARRIGSLVNAEGAEIILLYVEKPPALITEDMWISPKEKREREIERQLEAEKIFALANAELARQGLISHLQIAVEGDPPDEILQVADEISVDLIAMGSHGKSGVLSMIMGSTSRKVLDQAKCPVLIVRIPDAEMVKAGLIES